MEVRGDPEGGVGFGERRGLGGCSTPTYNPSAEGGRDIQGRSSDTVVELGTDTTLYLDEGEGRDGPFLRLTSNKPVSRRTEKGTGSLPSGLDCLGSSVSVS